MLNIFFMAINCAIIKRTAENNLSVPHALNVTRRALNKTEIINSNTSRKHEKMNETKTDIEASNGTSTINTIDSKTRAQLKKLLRYEKNPYQDQSELYNKIGKNIIHPSNEYNISLSTNNTNVTSKNQENQEKLISAEKGQNCTSNQVNNSSVNSNKTENFNFEKDKNPYDNQGELYMNYGKDIFPPSKGYNITTIVNETISNKTQGEEDPIIAKGKSPYYDQGELYEKYGKDIFPPCKEYNITPNSTVNSSLSNTEKMIIDKDKSPYENQGELYENYGQSIYPPTKGYNITSIKNQTFGSNITEKENSIIGQKNPYLNQRELFEKYGKNIIPPSNEYNISYDKNQFENTEQKEEDGTHEESPYNNADKMTVRLPKFYQDKSTHQKFSFPQDEAEFLSLSDSHKIIVAKLLIKIASSDDSADDDSKTLINKAIKIYKDIDSNVKNNDDEIDYFRENRNEKSPLPPNTAISRNGSLVCLDGYIASNSIINKSGCWKCESKCHKKAKCVSPGTCECPSGFTGDGVSFCIPPTPHIVSALGRNTIIVEYANAPPGFFPPEAFCLFSDQIVTASSFNNTSVTCEMPSDVNSWSVAISFDGELWSDTKEIRRERTGFLTIAAYAIAIAAILIFLMKPVCTQCKKPAVDDTAPLMISPEMPDVRYAISEAE